MGKGAGNGGGRGSSAGGKSGGARGSRLIPTFLKRTWTAVDRVSRWKLAEQYLAALRVSTADEQAQQQKAQEAERITFGMIWGSCEEGSRAD